MTYLGRGWQYTTYDLGNGRVRKIYNSKRIGYLIIAKDAFLKFWEVPKLYARCKEKAEHSMRVIPTLQVESWMMGNPTILNELDYEQDKATPLHRHLQSVDTEIGKKIIDAFVELTTYMRGKGVIDKSFKIDKNFGLDAQGRIILLDLGELYTDERVIAKRIEERPWEFSAKFIPKALRTYFLKQMQEAFIKAQIQS